MKTKLVLLVLLFGFTNLYSQTFEFVFENNTSSTISEIYSAGNGDEWSYNLLQDYIGQGESMEISYLPPYDICLYDFIAIGLDGNRYIYNDVDLCNTNLLIMADINLEGNTHGDEWAGEENSDDNYIIDGDINDVITYNTWRITQDGYDYGTLKLNADGSAIKTGPAGTVVGNWSLDDSGYYITLHFPEEGQATTAELNYRGNEMDLMFEGESGTYQWLLVSM